MIPTRRVWLHLEVERMVAYYKAGNWNGVHTVINRMLELDADGAVILTRAEAAQCGAALFTEDGIWGLDPKNRALAERLAGSV